MFSTPRTSIGNLGKAYKFSSRRFSGDQLTYIAKHGEETYPRFTLEKAELKDAGYKAEDIAFITKNAKGIMMSLKARERVGYYSKCGVVAGWRNGHQNKNDDVPPIPRCDEEIDINRTIM